MLTLLEGWNPWIEESRPEEYALFDEVCDKYNTYLSKMTKEGGITAGTKFNYEHKLAFMRKWIDKILSKTLNKSFAINSLVSLAFNVPEHDLLQTHTAAARVISLKGYITFGSLVQNRRSPSNNLLDRLIFEMR